jgi:hypothetical protein
MTKRDIILIFSLIAAAVVAVAMREPLSQWQDEQDHSKSIKFSHTFHIKDQGIACEDCHILAKGSQQASDNILGNHESCKSCHEEQLSNNCAYCHVDPDNIVAIKNPERDILFSHELHTTKQSFKCETCHAGLDSVQYATLENMPAMNTCMKCHTSQKVSTNCETCHNDFAGLIPSDHLAGDFKKDHKKITRISGLDISCATCHSESFCQDCHTGIELHSFGIMKDLMTDPSPRGSTKDSPKQLRLQQVHDLNYRFTHGVDVKAKTLDCSSCHDQQEFCVKCHDAGGNITQQKIRPQSHNEAGFAIPIKGSGGGRHAELARRDIESCISCHDVKGKDPICLMCHTENGGVR